jgi:hypothetical protein
MATEQPDGSANLQVLDGKLQRGRAQLSAEGITTRLAGSPDSLLQRGRVHLSAEGAKRLAVDLREDKASTGPRSIERGRELLDQGAGAFPVASTGPRSIERGRLLESPEIERRLAVASTGPRSIERGRWRLLAEGCRSSFCFNGAALGWARNNCRRSAGLGQRGHTSTEPHSVEHGMDGAMGSEYRQHDASTGPRSIERGRPQPAGWRC